MAVKGFGIHCDGMNNIKANLTHHYQPWITVLNAGDNLSPTSPFT